MLPLDFFRRANWVLLCFKKIESKNPTIHVMGVVYVRDNVGTPIRGLKAKENVLALHQKPGAWMYIDMFYV